MNGLEVLCSVGSGFIAIVGQQNWLAAEKNIYVSSISSTLKEKKTKVNITIQGVQSVVCNIMNISTLVVCVLTFMFTCFLDNLFLHFN